MFIIAYLSGIILVLFSGINRSEVQRTIFGAGDQNQTLIGVMQGKYLTNVLFSSPLQYLLI